MRLRGVSLVGGGQHRVRTALRGRACTCTRRRRVAHRGINGRGVAVFNLGGSFYGLFGRWQLGGGPFVGGISSEGPGNYSYDCGQKLLACPWHGWEFDVESGQSYLDPRRGSVPANWSG